MELFRSLTPLLVKYWPLITTSTLYVIQVFICLINRDYYQAGVFGGYAIAGYCLVGTL